MMKKLFISMVMSLLASTGVSEACIQINFQSPLFAQEQLIDHNSLALSATSMFVVYWSSDAVQDFNSTDPLTPLNDDLVLDVLPIADPGAGWSQDGDIIGWNNNYYGATNSAIYSPGYLYIAAFEQDYSLYSGSFSEGTYYGLGGMLNPLTQNQNNSTLFPDDYCDIIAPSSGGTAITTSLQVIPEPGTMVLFGLGLVTLALRRRRNA